MLTDLAFFFDFFFAFCIFAKNTRLWALIQNTHQKNQYVKIQN